MDRTESEECKRFINDTHAVHTEENHIWLVLNKVVGYPEVDPDEGSEKTMERFDKLYED